MATAAERSPADVLQGVTTDNNNPITALLKACVRTPGVTIVHSRGTQIQRESDFTIRCLQKVFGNQFASFLHHCEAPLLEAGPEGGYSASAILQDAPLPLSYGMSPQTAPHVRFPDAKDIASSFYGNRHDAVVAWGYGRNVSTYLPSPCPANVGELLPIAADRPNGATSKRFQCIPRHQLASFVATVPSPLQRNLYALVDDVHYCDPYFDIDADLRTLPHDAVRLLTTHLLDAARRSPVTSSDGAASVSDEVHCAMEVVLSTCLTFLASELENYFTLRCGAASTVQETLILTASSCVQHKLSYHIHMRFCTAAASADGVDSLPLRSVKAPCAFSSVMEHKLFADSMAAKLTETASGGTKDSPASPLDQATAQVLLAVLDLSVYTRWRAFRLPYNIKSVDISNIVQRSNDVDDASPALLSQLLSTTDAAATALGTYASPGAVCRGICVGCNQRIKDVDTKEDVNRSLLHRLRPLLPLDHSACSSLLSAALTACSCVPAPDGLDSHLITEFVQRCFDLASITRPALSLAHNALHPSLSYNKRLREEDDTLPQESMAEESYTGFDDALVHDEGRLTMPHLLPTAIGHSDTAPFPSGRRVTLNSPAVRMLMWRLFQCLHPTAFQNLRPDHLNVVFEDAGQRYWYVYQKQNRYCLNLNRQHQQTCGQLYLTYGSIKFRCYSNDCCRMPCWRRCWGVVGAQQESGGAHLVIPEEEQVVLDALRDIHCKLFPELDEQQLRLRFPGSVLAAGHEGLPSLPACGKPDVDAEPMSQL